MAHDRYLALQVIMMPKDMNPLALLHVGTDYPPVLSIFGGIILSYIDQAGAIAARRHVQLAGGEPPNIVTVAFNRVEFKKPVLVGDVVRFLTRCVKMGTTSITMQIDVEAERGTEVLHVTEAEVVYVGVDPRERRPKPLLPK
jgi:acyl-CoA thioesterase YciA